MLFVPRRAPVDLFETNKKPKSDFSVEGQHEFRALLFVPRRVDELFPEWLDVPNGIKQVTHESTLKGWSPQLLSCDAQWRVLSSAQV